MFNKFFILICTFALASTGLNAGVDETLAPDKRAAIIIGLHRQILDFNTLASYKDILKTGLSNIRTTGSLLANKQFIADCKQYWGAEKRGTEFILEQLEKNHPQFTAVSKDLLDAIHQHNLNTDYVQLVEDLKRNGYQVVIATSAGPKTVALHAARHPEFFANNIIIHGEQFDDFRGNPTFWEKIRARVNKTTPILAVERDPIRQEQARAAGVEAVVVKNASQARAEIEKRFGPLH